MSPWKPFRLAGLTLVCALALVGTAFSDAITIYNTGQDNNGMALPIGVLDPHYALVSAPPGVPLTAITTSPNAAWVLNTSTADWISPSASGNDSWPVGTYDYQTTFNLVGDPLTAQLMGQWASDNDACIFLNGVNTNACTGFEDFGHLTSFLIASGFKSGSNTLDFIVNNGGGPTGVFVEISGTENVPEPSSLLLMGSGILSATFGLRRKLFGR